MNKHIKIILSLIFVFFLFNLIFLLTNWSMFDEWRIYQLKDGGFFRIFDFVALDRFFPAYLLFFWGIGKVFGQHLLIFYLIQNILLAVSLVVLYRFSCTLTKNPKLSALVPLLLFTSTSVGENFCRLGTAEAKLLPFFVLFMVTSFNYVFKNKKLYLFYSGILFFISILLKESVVFVLLSFFAFAVLLFILKERTYFRRILTLFLCLVIAIALRMEMFYGFGGIYFTGKGYVAFDPRFRHLFTNILNFSLTSASVGILILLDIYLYFFNKKRGSLSSECELQLAFLTSFALFPLLILLFWGGAMSPYLLLPFIFPVFIIFAMLYVWKSSIFSRFVIPVILITTMFFATVLNIRYFTVFFSRSNGFQNMLSYVSDITPDPGQRVLMNIDRGGYLETYDAAYYYLKNKYNRDLYLGSFVPVTQTYFFWNWGRGLAKEGLDSFKTEGADKIKKNDILIVFSREPVNLSTYYAGKLVLRRSFDSLTWLYDLSQIKRGKFFNKETWFVYEAS